jgi:hypothetical protein
MLIICTQQFFLPETKFLLHISWKMSEMLMNELFRKTNDPMMFYYKLELLVKGGTK